MAERIDNFEYRRGRTPLYPWDEWMDGSAWRITRGEDFAIPIDSMRAMLFKRATMARLSVRTNVTEGGEGIEFQFSEPAMEPAA